MIIKKQILLALLSILILSSYKNEVSNKEKTLAQVINSYRIKKGLYEIPISPALTKVAEAHVRDLDSNQPHGGKCNLHSWSKKGKWSACCYTSNHAKASCMWDKPRELTNYKGDGYEISAWMSNGITAEQALEMWIHSQGHHHVMVNKGIWKKVKWNAMGAAIYNGYAVVWFGKELDTSN